MEAMEVNIFYNPTSHHPLMLLTKEVHQYLKAIYQVIHHSFSLLVSPWCKYLMISRPLFSFAVSDLTVFIFLLGTAKLPSFAFTTDGVADVGATIFGVFLLVHQSYSIYWYHIYPWNFLFWTCIFNTVDYIFLLLFGFILLFHLFILPRSRAVRSAQAYAFLVQVRFWSKDKSAALFAKNKRQSTFNLS